jgi:aspartate racemase
MSKRIGILGGIGPESTLEYYRRIIKRYLDLYGDYYFPEIVIFSLNFQRFTDYEDRGEKDHYVEEIMSGIHALENAGVDFIVMSANSPHAVFDQVERRARVPMISIVKTLAEEAKARGLHRLLLLGIKFTMQNSFYQDTCRQFSIEVITPSEKDQDAINRLIFDELNRGIFKDESRDYFLSIIQKYPAEGVILGCTELPLLLKQKDSPITMLDTVELHIRAMLKFAMDD